MTVNFKEIGLSYSGKYSDHTSLSVANWIKFFPVINVQAEKPLIFLATNYWYAKVLYSKVSGFLFNVRIDGVEKRYNIIHHTGYKSDIESQQKFIKLFCPYNKNDIRKYVWINILKQYNYAKICKDTQDVLIDLLGGKND